MDVVVLVLVHVLTEVGSSPLDVLSGLRVGVHGPLLVQLGLVLGEHVLFVFPNLSFGSGGDVLGGESLGVHNWLDSVLRIVSTRRMKPKKVVVHTWWW